MRTLALLFLAVGVANLVFARRAPSAARWNIVMGIVGMFAGGALAVLGDDGAPVLYAAVPVMLVASYLHNRAQRLAHSDDATSIDPPV